MWGETFFCREMFGNLGRYYYTNSYSYYNNNSNAEMLGMCICKVFVVSVFVFFFIILYLYTTTKIHDPRPVCTARPSYSTSKESYQMHRRQFLGHERENDVLISTSLLSSFVSSIPGC